MSSDTAYQLYPIRWLFLATVAFLNLVCMLSTVSFSPVATLVTNYYKINGDQLDNLVLTAWAINVAGMLVAVYCIGRFHLLVSLRYAASMTFLGGLIRACSTAFSSIAPQSQFWFTYVGQLIMSLGHPVVITMSTKVSQTWFGEQERPLTTTLLGLAPVLGGMTGQALAPLIMNDKPENLPYLNLATASPLILTTLISWLALKTAVPPTPPSRSAEKLLTESPPSLALIGQSLLQILKNKSVLAIILCQGSGAGLMSTLLTQLNQMMCSRNYSIEESTLTAVLNIILGFFGAFVFNYLAKRLHKQIEFAKVIYGLACISTILLVMALNTYGKLWWIALGFGGFGFFGYAAFPMSLELAAEETYPIDASFSEACVHIVSNSTAIVLVLLGNVMYFQFDGILPPNQCLKGKEVGVEPRDYTPYYYVIMSMCFVLSLTFIFLMNPSMRRSNEDGRNKAS